MIKELLNNKKISIYRLAKESGIAYATINDICNGKTRLEKCSAETIYRIAKVLDVSMESIIEPCLVEREDFELFKSNTCHRLKELGDIQFVIELLEKDYIQEYYRRKWYTESLYLLAMLDYISRENDIPICTKYDNIRVCKLKKPLFPSGVLVSAKINQNDDILQRSIDEAIPEFRRFNIIESEVRNAV